MIDLLAARKFLRALGGSAEAPFVFQTFTDWGDPKPKPDPLARVYIGPLQTVAAHLEALNDPKARAGVFVQVQEGAGRGNDNITGLRVLFADDDGEGLGPARWPLPPSIIVKSSEAGRKQHAYWLLKPGEPLTAYKAVQQRIAAVLGTDPLHNLDRVMRLPGTLHHKMTPPQAVRVVECRPELRYTIVEMSAALVAMEREGLSRAAGVPGGTPAAGAQLLYMPSDAVTPEQRAAGERIRAWLVRRGRTFREVAPYAFRLDTCILNPSHGATMVIRAETRGGFYAGCFHASCGSNQNCWKRVKTAIGGWDDLPAGGFVRGDDTEVGRRYIADENTNAPAPVVWVDYFLWKYAESTGLWFPVADTEERVAIMRYAGAPVGARQLPLKLDSHKITGVAKCGHDIAANPTFFRQAPPGVTFANGHLRVTATDVGLVAPSPDHRARLGLAFAYEPRPVPLFLRFLHDMFRDDGDRPAKIDCLQEFLGACLLGIATRYETACILEGRGSNGKSQLIKIVAALFPPSAITAVKPQAMADKFERARLVNSRINLVSELPESDILESEAFKAIISGDLMDGRNPYEKSITFTATAGHLYAANSLPATGDTTLGFWRKVLVIACNRNFEGDPEKVTAIAAGIIAAELAGIAAWVVEGGIRLLKQDRYTVPPSSEAAKAKWRIASDPVARFFQECLAPAPPGTGTPVFALFRTFCDWAQAHNHSKITSQTFLKRVGNVGYRLNEDGSVPVVIARMPEPRAMLPYFTS